LALVPGLDFSPNSVKTDQIQLNLNFKLVQTLTDQKLDLLELLKFEINYGFEDIEMMNIFLHKTSLDSEWISNKNLEKFLDLEFNRI
jgi:hypothetical protein